MLRRFYGRCRLKNGDRGQWRGNNGCLKLRRPRLSQGCAAKKWPSKLFCLPVINELRCRLIKTANINGLKMGVLFMASPSSADLSHRNPAFAGQSRDSWHVQRRDEDIIFRSITLRFLLLFSVPLYAHNHKSCRFIKHGMYWICD